MAPNELHVSAVNVPPVQLTKWSVQPELVVKAETKGQPGSWGGFGGFIQTALPKPSTSVNTLLNPGLANAP